MSDIRKIVLTDPLSEDPIPEDRPAGKKRTRKKLKGIPVREARVKEKIWIADKPRVQSAGENPPVEEAAQPETVRQTEETPQPEWVSPAEEALPIEEDFQDDDVSEFEAAFVIDEEDADEEAPSIDSLRKTEEIPQPAAVSQREEALPPEDDLPFGKELSADGSISFGDAIPEEEAFSSGEALSIGRSLLIEETLPAEDIPQPEKIPEEEDATRQKTETTVKPVNPKRKKNKKKKRKGLILHKINEKADSEPVVRDVRESDAAAIAQIYAYYVQHSAVTFDLEAPDEAYFRKKIEEVTRTYPFVVAESGGEVVGYAYAGPFKDRGAYFCSVENSVYVRKDCRGKGIGAMLYDELEFQLKERAFVNAYACVAYPNEEDRYLDKSSMLFHRAQGYTVCGLFQNCAIKFDTWYSMVWMVKKL